MSGLAQYLHPALWRDGIHAATAQLGYATFWLAVLQIIFVNLLLSGDNAVVIALACRGLPPPQRRWGVLAGAGVAVLLRVTLVGALAWLMGIAYFKLLGGLALLGIAARLLVPETAAREEIPVAEQLWRAISIIALADIVMSVDNMVAIAAIAQSNVVLLVFGLALSIPLIVAGASLVMTLLDRVPILIWAGAALLGWIAGGLIVADPVLATRLAAAFGPSLTAQIAFAAPPTGAALAIAAGGLWRGLHLRKAERAAAQA